MDKIICLVGASGSGKTTVAKELHDLGYNVIQSYTTRMPRWENEWGHTFLEGHIEIGRYNHNCLPESFIEYDKKGNPIKEYIDVIAFFNDYNKRELYFATREQYKRKGKSIYVVDPHGAAQVRKNVTDAKVITIFLMCDEHLRYIRLAKDRGSQNADSRIIKDREIFKTCKCDYVVNTGRNFDLVMDDVLSIIDYL